MFVFCQYFYIWPIVVRFSLHAFIQTPKTCLYSALPYLRSVPCMCPGRPDGTRCWEASDSGPTGWKPTGIPEPVESSSPGTYLPVCVPLQLRVGTGVTHPLIMTLVASLSLLRHHGRAGCTAGIKTKKDKMASSEMMCNCPVRIILIIVIVVVVAMQDSSAPPRWTCWDGVGTGGGSGDSGRLSIASSRCWDQ